MKRSTTTSKELVIKVAAVCFWLIVWQAAAFFISNSVLLVSPLEVVATLFRLAVTASFWQSVLTSTTRIMAGYTAALILGIALGYMSKNQIISSLLHPITSAMRATPVASFTILALLWVGSSGLAVFIAFIMGFPIIYAGMSQGIASVDFSLVEMARVFNIKKAHRVLYVYMPQILPSLATAAKVALGMCWKSGVAAEVIGLPSGTIGERLYQAKIYLSTGELFAWTLVVIVLSAIIEKVVVKIIDSIKNMSDRGICQ